MSDSFAEIQQRLELLAQAWDQAERTLKVCSGYLGEAPRRGEGDTSDSKIADVLGPITQASILELRYAGRRVMDAVNAGLFEPDDPRKVKRAIDFIADAHFCCLRAQHDCIDSALYFVDRVVIGFESEFSLDLLRQHCDRYSELKICLRKTAQLIVESRGRRERREDIYKEIEEKYLGDMLAGARNLQSSKGTLEAAKGEQSLLVEIHEEQNRISKRQNRLSWVLAAIGWGIAVFAIFWM